MKYLLDDSIFDLFEENFELHAGLLMSMEAMGYKLTETFFREILSGDISEFKANEIDEIKKALSDSKSDLVPVLVFSKGKSGEWIYLELHK